MSAETETFHPTEAAPAAADLSAGQFRKLVPSDHAAFLAHLLRLDPLSRFTRFAGLTSDAEVRRHAARVFAGDAVLVGYFVGEALRAAAELHPHRPRSTRAPRIAEAAFSVERDWQGHGVGSHLLRQLLLLAQNRGIGQLSVAFLATNGQMKRLAIRHDAELQVEGNEIIGHMAAPRATPFSRLREWSGDVFSLVRSAFDLQARLLEPPLRGN